MTLRASPAVFGRVMVGSRVMGAGTSVAFWESEPRMPSLHLGVKTLFALFSRPEKDFVTDALAFQPSGPDASRIKGVPAPSRFRGVFVAGFTGAGGN